MQITAIQLRKGDTFQTASHTYTVEATRTEAGVVSIKPVNFPYEVDFYEDSPVELQRRPEAEQDAEARRFAGQQVREAQQELARMKRDGDRNVPADHRIEFEDRGARRTARYTTRDGFLKALVRLYSAPTRYSVLHVD